jgi:hypothetical protein
MIAKGSSSSSSSSTMGVLAVSHEDNLAQIRRNQELSLIQARERDALLERAREERVVGGELEWQQPAPSCNTAPPWLQALLSRASSTVAGASVLGNIRRCSGIDVSFPEPLVQNFPLSLNVVVPAAARIFRLICKVNQPSARRGAPCRRRSWLRELRAE